MTSLANFTLDQITILIDAREGHDQNTRKLEACEKDFIRQGLALWTSADESKRQSAEALLVTFWNESEKIGRKASVRNQFSKVAKKDYEHIFNGAGVNVENNKLAIAKKREIKKTPLEELAAELLKMSKDGMPEAEQARLATLFAKTVANS
jgi:hypothetical protein